MFYKCDTNSELPIMGLVLRFLFKSENSDFKRVRLCYMHTYEVMRGPLSAPSLT